MFCYRYTAFWSDYITWISSTLQAWNRLYLAYSITNWSTDSHKFSSFWIAELFRLVRCLMFLPSKNSNEIGICFSFDKLTIYDGGSMTSPMIGEYCYSAPSSKISSSNQLFFHFHSNGYGTSTGFKLEYNAKSKNLGQFVSRVKK